MDVSTRTAITKNNGNNCWLFDLGFFLFCADGLWRCRGSETASPRGSTRRTWTRSWLDYSVSRYTVRMIGKTRRLGDRAAATTRTTTAGERRISVDRRCAARVRTAVEVRRARSETSGRRHTSPAPQRTAGLVPRHGLASRPPIGRR